MEYSVKERIKTFIKSQRITQKSFEQSIGAKNGYVNSISKSIGGGYLQAIIREFPMLNTDWLLTGEGDMLKTNTTAPALASTPDIRPHIPSLAEAGTLGGVVDAVMRSDCEMRPLIPTFPDYDYTMTVRGDSMLPAFESGDDVAIKKATRIIEWGRPYVIDTVDGVLLKRLYDEGDQIRCVSFNPDYPDILIDKADIRGAYKVVGQLRRWAV